jgi:alpha-tubulin suppressor-like RCC1 family protein
MFFRKLQTKTMNNHSLALTDDEVIWSLGVNSYGQLGDGTNTDSYVTPVRVIL